MVINQTYNINILQFFPVDEQFFKERDFQVLRSIKIQVLHLKEQNSKNLKLEFHISRVNQIHFIKEKLNYLMKLVLRIHFYVDQKLQNKDISNKGYKSD